MEHTVDHNTSFKYWYKVLELEKNILLLVRSLRQSDLLLDIACQNRRAAALELFKTEFTGVPECFVKYGIPFQFSRHEIRYPEIHFTHILQWHPSVSTDDQDGESFDVYIVDLSVQIRAKALVRDSLDKEMTYSQFCLSILNGACNFAKSVGANCRAVGPCCRYVPDRLYQRPNAKEKGNVFRNKI